MLVTHVPSLGSKAERNLYHTTISLRTRVNVTTLTVKGRNLLLNQERKLEYVLLGVLLILVVSTATLRCLEPSEISNSKRVPSSHLNSRL